MFCIGALPLLGFEPLVLCSTDSHNI